MTYAEKLLDPRWQKMRLQVLERDNFACTLCKDTTTTLHVHHFCYAKTWNPWDVSEDCLTTYCKHCHWMVESPGFKDAVFFKAEKFSTKTKDFMIAVYMDTEIRMLVLDITNDPKMIFILQREIVERMADVFFNKVEHGTN